MEGKDITLGERRVRVEFNPSSEHIVDIIKNKTAELINLIEKCPSEEPEVRRLIALALTDYENAATWAVKAMTFKN